jgi:hypothetical protein
MRVSRVVDDGVVDEVKTEYSEDELPLDPDLATVLLNWKERSPKSEAGWMSPSPITGPCYHASPIQRTTFVRLDESSAWLPPHVSLLARLGWHFDGCAAEADAARADCNDHESLWRRRDGVGALSQ